MLKISSAFDGGNIEVISCDETSKASLSIRVDNKSDFYQWFYFRATGAKDKDCVFTIENAGNAAYADGWEGYQAVASYDREYWFRVPTGYTDGKLTINHRPELNSCYYAYFAPYTTERHADLVAHLCHSPLVNYEHLGHTLDGQDMDLLRIGEPGPGKKTMWAIARQHPGETMAEWWMEGFLTRLTDPDDPVARALLEKAVFYVVPNMNPDGSRRGHLRTNAAGANLNREWLEPTMDRSPEVLFVREKMQQTGVDFCLDVHGDEALPHNFIAGAEGTPNWSDRQANLQEKFKSDLQAITPDFQTEHGYDVDEPGTASLKMCTDWVANEFNCLAMTLEMPFKDTTDNPIAETGWSPSRCELLGSACLDAMARIADEL